MVVDGNYADADTDYDDDRPPWEYNTSTQTDNQLDGYGISTLGAFSRESPSVGLEDVINPKMVEGAVIQDDSKPCTSGDGKMLDTECSNTLKRHRMIFEIDGDARSDRSIDQPQRPMEKKAKMQGEFSAPKNASNSGGNDGNGGGGDGDSDNHTTCDTLPTRKRKRPSPAHTVSRKRHS